jgi:hypothetical protein
MLNDAIGWQVRSDCEGYEMTVDMYLLAVAILEVPQRSAYREE